MIYALFILDMIYYYKDDSSSWKKAINDMFQWFSVWSLFYTFFVSIILFFYEIKFFKKNMKLFYYYLKISTVSYSTGLFLIYNGLCLIKPNMITDSQTSIDSLIEHKIIPILFILYFLVSKRKNINNNFKNNEILLKIVLVSLILPIIYTVYCLILGYKYNTYPYFFYNINRIGLGLFLCYIFSILLFVFIISLSYSTILLKTNNLNLKIKKLKFKFKK